MLFVLKKEEKGILGCLKNSSVCNIFNKLKHLMYKLNEIKWIINAFLWVTELICSCRTVFLHLFCQLLHICVAWSQPTSGTHELIYFSPGCLDYFFSISWFWLRNSFFDINPQWAYQGSMSCWNTYFQGIPSLTQKDQSCFHQSTKLLK